MPQLVTAETKIDQTSISYEGDTMIIEGVNLGRVGIQHYSDGTDYRPDSEVFSSQHLKSIEGAPVTIGHPPVPGKLLNSQNQGQYRIGIARDVHQDGDFIRGTLVVTDAAAIKKVEGGLRGISMGYMSNTTPEPGIHKGERYDRVQRDLMANHVALVSNPRCGEGCRFDEIEPIKTPVKKSATLPEYKTITIGAKTCLLL